MPNDAYDRLSEWILDKFGPARFGAYFRGLIRDRVFSTWDLYLLGAILVAGFGPRAWAIVPIVALWGLGRIWARWSHYRHLDREFDRRRGR